MILPVVSLCLYYGGWAYNGLILLVMAGLVWEGECLLGQEMLSLRGVLLCLWPVCTGLIFLKGQYIPALYLALSGLFFGWRAWGPVFVSLVGGIGLLWLRSRSHGMEEVLFVLACVIASDSTAYVTGKILGGPKLAPSISPGKTISGSLGGLLGSVGAGAIVAWCAMGHVNAITLLWAGLLGGATQAGDLAESAFKRRLGVKDSGKLIPGHGGLLDRFDGLLLAVPIAVILALIAGADVFFWCLSG